MGLSESLNGTLFDNETWVNQNRSHLSPLDPNLTFRYVTSHHPYMGCAFSPMSTAPRFNKTLSLRELSKYADAVTVCCYDSIGHQFSGSTNPLLQRVNETAVGNSAYTALNHSDPNVRDKVSQYVEEWKTS